MVCVFVIVCSLSCIYLDGVGIVFRCCKCCSHCCFVVWCVCVKLAFECVMIETCSLIIVSLCALYVCTVCMNVSIVLSVSIVSNSVDRSGAVTDCIILCVWCAYWLLCVGVIGGVGVFDAALVVCVLCLCVCVCVFVFFLLFVFRKSMIRFL